LDASALGSGNIVVTDAPENLDPHSAFAGAASAPFEA
jgi:hypothetical protein